MTDTTQTLLDRLEIAEALARYAYGIDDRDFEVVRALFTTDAHLDYTASGGPAADRDKVIAWIESGMGVVGPSQHLVTNVVVDLDGDEATSRCLLFNPMIMPLKDPLLLYLGGGYRDDWRRTDDGWRIVHRVQEIVWSSNGPVGTIPGL